jgi:hypothetical protein
MALGSTQPLNRNDYQQLKKKKNTLGVKGGRRVGLKALPPSISRLSKSAVANLIHLDGQI